MMPSMSTKSKQTDGTTDWQSTGHCTFTTHGIQHLFISRLFVHTAHFRCFASGQSHCTPVVSRLDVHTAHNFRFATGRSHSTRPVYPYVANQHTSCITLPINYHHLHQFPRFQCTNQFFNAKLMAICHGRRRFSLLCTHQFKALLMAICHGRQRNLLLCTLNSMQNNGDLPRMTAEPLLCTLQYKWRCAIWHKIPSGLLC